MTRSCGGAAGGLTRVAYLDMTDSNQDCYDTLLERNVPAGARTCAPLEDTGTCSSVQFPSPISYSKVCGLVHAYYGQSLDGFNGGGIDDIYVEGVSLTHGISPNRNHIWSFVGKRCGGSGCGTVPTYVGTDYFCDGGPYNSFNRLMWDGVCESPCKDCDGDPWFTKPLTQSTSDDIEMRSDVG